MFEKGERMSQGSSMSMMNMRHTQERDQLGNYDGSELLGKVALCSEETSIPTGEDGIQHASSNGTLFSGRMSQMKRNRKFEAMTGPVSTRKDEMSKASRVDPGALTNQNADNTI